MTTKVEAPPQQPHGQMAMENTRKRDTLTEIERKYQAKWKKDKAFEINAPTLEEEPNLDSKQLHEKYPKFYGMIAFPYMNGSLHLGHAFSISKVEFAAAYARLQGKRALFPFGFHCTGMPIKACADKLARELEQFGPEFNLPQEEIDSHDEHINPLPSSDGNKFNKEDVTSEIKTRFSGKKSKAMAKTSIGLQYQFQIMRSMGISNEEIKKFANAEYWLEYFPPIAMEDVSSLGCHVDWRRSFYTTDANPYFDSFVRWQMNKLRAMQKIKFGKRYTIYSIKDGQPCMDHDRSSGEGVGPQEYTGIKMQVVEWSENAQKVLGDKLSGKIVYLIAATLRPETMYGQTNCFVGTKINYGLFQVNDKEVFLCSNRAARNMAYQEICAKEGEIIKLTELSGQDIVGARIKAPLSIHDEVYVLPMETVLESKGTGVVTSVPSDSPDDFATISDLQKKAEYYKIKPEWASKEIIPIIETPTYGNLTAPKLVKDMKIQSQKDQVQLAKAKEEAYREGFYKGIMIVGEFKGEKVSDAKNKVRDLMIGKKLAFVYNEPEKQVISRSGDECIVALCDQWYLDYGEPEWRKQTEEVLKRLNTFAPETRHAFQSTLAWLNQWACARSYGLGTHLPWDHDFLVESLSDSTIYMAYYTIAHLLHGGNLNGSQPGPLGIKAKEMTDEVWEYIFCNVKPSNTLTIPKEKLDILRREFDYFYPIDLRTSGKELIQNHLTFFLYNHACIFEERYWPKGVRCNGHLLLNGEKMSKSTGNNMMLKEGVEKFGADATRITLADAGDGLDDANFDESNANAAILRLFTLKEWCEEVIQKGEGLRKPGIQPKTNFYDQVFENEMNHLIENVENEFDKMMFRGALKLGFFDFQLVRDWYRDVTILTGDGMEPELIRTWVRNQALMVCTFAPHWAEYIWMEVLKEDKSILDARFPKISKPVSLSILHAGNYIRSTMKAIRDAELMQLRKKQKKGGKGVNVNTYDMNGSKELAIYIAKEFPEWQEKVVENIRKYYNKETGKVDDSGLRKEFGNLGLLKDKRVMPYVAQFKTLLSSTGEEAFNRKLLFDEFSTIEMNIEYFKAALGFDIIRVKYTTDIEPSGNWDIQKLEQAIPGHPAFIFWNVDKD